MELSSPPAHFQPGLGLSSSPARASQAGYDRSRCSPPNSTRLSNLDEFSRSAGRLKESDQSRIDEARPDGGAPLNLFARSTEAAPWWSSITAVSIPSPARAEKEGVRFAARLLALRAALLGAITSPRGVPVLTPIGLDPAHPFPRVLNNSLNFALNWRDARFCLIRAFAIGRRRACLRADPPASGGRPRRDDFVFLSSILHAHVTTVPGHEVRAASHSATTQSTATGRRWIATCAGAAGECCTAFGATGAARGADHCSSGGRIPAAAVLPRARGLYVGKGLYCTGCAMSPTRSGGRRSSTPVPPVLPAPLERARTCSRLLRARTAAAPPLPFICAGDQLLRAAATDPHVSDQQTVFAPAPTEKYKSISTRRARQEVTVISS